MRRFVEVAAAALLAAACADATGPARLTADGTWFGQETGGPTLMTLNLTHRGDSISGRGTMNVGREIPVNVAGAVDVSSVNVTLTATGYQPVMVRGSFTARDEIIGYMIGSGFIGDEIVLHRQN